MPHTRYRSVHVYMSVCVSILCASRFLLPRRAEAARTLLGRMPGIMVGMDQKDSCIGEAIESKRRVFARRARARTFRCTRTYTSKSTGTSTRCSKRTPPGENEPQKQETQMGPGPGPGPGPGRSRGLGSGLFCLVLESFMPHTQYRFVHVYMFVCVSIICASRFFAETHRGSAHSSPQDAKHHGCDGPVGQLHW